MFPHKGEEMILVWEGSLPMIIADKDYVERH